MIRELKPYPAYKDSGMPWLGQVPVHWEMHRAKWLFRKMERPVRGTDEVVTCFRDGVVTLRKNRRVRGFTESLKEIGYQGIRRGDLVIHAMDAFAGAVGVADADGKGTPVYSVCEPSPNADSYYYAYVVREMARSQWILALAKGIRERSTDFRYDDFGAQPVPLPPLPEQVAIARFLDHLDRRIQRYIVAKKKLVALLNEQKQAIIHRAVTRGLDPNVRLKPSGVEWLGDVPEHWRIEPAFAHLRERFERNPGERASRVLSLSYGRIIEKDTSNLTGLLPATYDGYQVAKPGNIVLRLTDLQNDHRSLRVGLAGLAGLVTSAYLCLETVGDLVPAYAYALLHSYDLTKVFYGLGGGCRQSIGYDELKRLPMLVPSREEQDAIVREVGAETGKHESPAGRLGRLVVLASEYRTRLIADVVTGKLDVREAAAYLPEEAKEPGVLEEMEETDEDETVVDDDQEEEA